MSYKVYSGTGTVYMAPVNSSGVKTGNFIQVGDAFPLSVQVATKQTEVKSRMVERAGQIIASKTEIDKINGKLTLREWNAQNLAWAVSGLAVSQVAAGASVTDEEFTFPIPGEYKALTTGRRGLSAVVVTSSPAGTTYALNTDYLFDAQLGLFTSVAGGALAAGTVATLIDYTYAAKTGYQVSVGSSVQIRCAILAHLYDEYRGEHYQLEIDSAVLAASQEINFISEEGSEGEQLQFDMTLETLSGQSSPGRINGVPM
jgi:hypothetical protein